MFLNHQKKELMRFDSNFHVGYLLISMKLLEHKQYCKEISIYLRKEDGIFSQNQLALYNQFNKKMNLGQIKDFNRYNYIACKRGHVPLGVEPKH